MFLVLITQNTLFTQLRLFGVCPLAATILAKDPRKTKDIVEVSRIKSLNSF